MKLWNDFKWPPMDTGPFRIRREWFFFGETTPTKRLESQYPGLKKVQVK